MNDNIAHNIHDTLFRQTLSDKTLVADFLSNYLPAHILQHIDMSTLNICKETFVDANHRAHYADMLYQVRLTDNQSGYVYVLFEHKSSHDRFTALQLLRYVLEIWELHRKQNQKDDYLPLILPIVVYHGKTKGKPLRIVDLVYLPDESLRAYIPDFALNFYDFSPKAAEVIKGHMVLQAVLRCLKATHEAQAQSMVVEIFECVEHFEDNEYGLQWARTILYYVAHGVGVPEKTINELSNQNLTGRKRGIIMTMAQELHERGMAEGIILGRNEGFNDGRTKGFDDGRTKGESLGSVRILTRLLTRKFGERTLTPTIKNRLQTATADQLDYWGERLLDAQKIDDVFVLQ